MYFSDRHILLVLQFWVKRGFLHFSCWSPAQLKPTAGCCATRLLSLVTSGTYSVQRIGSGTSARAALHQSFFSITNQQNLSDFFSVNNIKIGDKLLKNKFFENQKCAQYLLALFIIFVGLTMTWYSKKMSISNRCIRGLIPKLIKKSWTVSKPERP